MMADEFKTGFTYRIEHIRNGVVISDEICKNLVPTAGLNHILDVAFKQGSQYPNWYIGLYEGNYVPVSGVTVSTLATDSGETTAYDEATRVAFVPGTISNGIVSNLASRAEFTFNANKTIYGGFITSSSGKQSNTGLAISVVRFQNPKTVTLGDVLRVTAGVTLTSS